MTDDETIVASLGRREEDVQCLWFGYLMVFVNLQQHPCSGAHFHVSEKLAKAFLISERAVSLFDDGAEVYDRGRDLGCFGVEQLGHLSFSSSKGEGNMLGSDGCLLRLMSVIISC